MRVGIENRLYVGINKIEPLYDIRTIKDAKIGCNYDECLRFDIIRYGIMYDDEEMYTMWIEDNKILFKPGKYNEKKKELVVDIHIGNSIDELCKSIQEAIIKFMVMVTGCNYRYSVSKKEAEMIKEYYEYQKNKEQ